MAEGARLESVYTGNRIEGSNPSLSATSVPEWALHLRRRSPQASGAAGFRSHDADLAIGDLDPLGERAKMVAAVAAPFKPDTLAALRRNRATGIRQHRHGMTCAHGRSSAASAPGISSNSGPRPQGWHRGADRRRPRHHTARSSGWLTSSGAIRVDRPAGSGPKRGRRPS